MLSRFYIIEIIMEGNEYAPYIICRDIYLTKYFECRRIDSLELDQGR